MSETISLLKILEDTVVDGPGFRISIYCAGCSHGCVDCHNPQSWNINNGIATSVDEIVARILRSSSDVTFTGGDPFFQSSAFTILAKKIKAHSTKNIWCYTGFKYEQLLLKPDAIELLKQIDVLVDGPFVKDKKDTNLLFRGSSNQRLIDVPKSLEKKQVVLFDYHPFPEF